MRHSQALPSGGSTRSRPLFLLWLAAFALVMSLIAVGPGAPRAARAADTIMPLADVTADMTGYAKTVVKGTTISTFDVTVVGVLYDEYPEAGGLIMLKVGGPVIEQTGGIAAGMSGSPVYIDGELAGAISYGYYMADHTFCLATPAESMMKVLQKSGGVSKAAGFKPGDVLELESGSVSLAGNKVSKVMLAEAAGTTQKIESAPSGTAVFRRLGPLFTLTGSKPGARGFNKLESRLASKGHPLVAGSRSKGTSDTTIEPGQAVGAGIITGDINLAAVGTTTYTDDDTVLAFGHPFFWTGATEYPMVNAEIVGVWPSIEAPFKVANIGNTVGAFEQDRMHGIAGKVQLVPDMVDETVTAMNTTDNTTVATKTKIARAAFDTSGELGWYDFWIEPAIITSDRAWDQWRGGTADVTWTVRATDVESGTPLTITRSNRFSNEYDIVWGGSGWGWYGDSFDELYNAVSGLEDLKQGAIRIDGIEFSAAFDESVAATTIDDVDIQGGGIVAGRSLPIRVTLTPYKQQTQTITLTARVPSGARRPYVVSVSSGRDYYGWGQPGDPEDASDVEAYQYFWQNKPTNERVYASVRGSSGDSYADEELLSDSELYGADQSSVYVEDTRTAVTTSTSTGFVVDGSLAKSQSVISARISPRPARAGGRVTFSGRITEPGMPSWWGSVVGRGEWVRIYRRLPGESDYRKVASVQTGSSGAYTRALSVTQTASYYVGWAGNDEYMKDWTGATTVGVRSAVSLTATPRIVSVGKSVHLKGSVNPSHSGMTVSLQRLTARGWRKFADAPLSGSSAYDEVWKPTRRGLYMVRAYFPADADNLAGWSPTREVLVR